MLSVKKCESPLVGMQLSPPAEDDEGAVHLLRSVPWAFVSPNWLGVDG